MADTKAESTADCLVELKVVYLVAPTAAYLVAHLAESTADCLAVQMVASTAAQTAELTAAKMADYWAA